MNKFLFVLGMMFISFVFGRLYPDGSVNTDVGVASASWMPEGAADGAFSMANHGSFSPPPTYSYEFTISEQDFISYLKSKGRESEEIKDTINVSRYLECLIRPVDFGKSGEVDHE